MFAIIVGEIPPECVPSAPVLEGEPVSKSPRVDPCRDLLRKYYPLNDRSKPLYEYTKRYSKDYKFERNAYPPPVPVSSPAFSYKPVPSPDPSYKPALEAQKLDVKHVLNFTPHRAGLICCASLKVWACWVKDIAENAKMWCLWINQTIKDIRHMAAVMRGKHFLE